MPEAREGPTFLIVWTRDSGSCRCVVDDEPALDAAVQRWIDSARTLDTLCLLTTACGTTYTVLASEVTAWIVSTPTARAASAAIDAALKAEEPEPWADGDG